MITANDLYDPNPDNSMLYQGDVVKGIPFPTWPVFQAENQASKWGILRPLHQGERSLDDALRALPNKLIGRAASDVPDAFQNSRKELVIGAARRTEIMVISRSCALDNPARKLCIVAPVSNIEGLPPEQKSPEKLGELRSGKIPHLFYLPALDRLPESFADLLKLTTVHRSFFQPEMMTEYLAARLSSAGTMALQHALSAHFGRQFGFDLEDICPQDGLYACANCFHSGLPAPHMQFEAGQPFGECPRCTDRAAFVKMPARLNE